MKCQSDTQTLAVIPAVHGSSQSVQLITDDGVWTFSQPFGNSCFSPEGFALDLHGNGVSAVGEVKFGALSPIKYDIMGPFQYVPFLQCRHSIVSMLHRVEGNICVNNVLYSFHHDSGYIEGDRGYSFPKEYAWTQTFFDGGSLMLSAADIPLLPFHFTGVIGIILWNGKEYRLATYLGAKLIRAANGELLVRQGPYTFSAKLIQKHALPLSAPVRGNMVRTIHESASCRAAYRFEKNGAPLFAFETDRASFEFEYGGKS